MADLRKNQDKLIHKHLIGHWKEWKTLRRDKKCQNSVL